MNTSQKETPEASDLDIEREFLVLPTGKGFFESEKSYKSSYDLKDEKDSFHKNQELLKAASKAQNHRSIEEAVLLSAKEPTSRTISDQTPKEAKEICREDQGSFLNLNITYSLDHQQLKSLKASSNALEKNLFLLKSKTSCFNSLQDLDFTRCLLGKQAIKALCSNSNLNSLKYLILTENPIRNSGVKFISETSNWPKLQTLNLCNIGINDDGIKWLAMNESWMYLKELDLSENPLIGDLGAINLYLNQTWTSLKTLGLRGCNVGKLGAAVLRRNRIYRALFAKDETALEDQTQNFRTKKSGGKCLVHKNTFLTDSFLDVCETQDPEKRPPTYPFVSLNPCLHDSKAQHRGGAPQDKDGDDSSCNYSSGLLAKFQQYKEKILNDTSLEKELNLFIAVHASTIPGIQDDGRTNNEGKNPQDQPLELSVDILRHLLDYESSEASKILLLTGQAGSGKSLFCKYLQRELFSSWFQNPDPEDRNWFPIYVELSSLKSPKSEAISETLTRELSLTKEEIRLLQDLKQSNLDLSRLLFIFDGYDAIEDIYALPSSSSRKDLINNNFFMLNKIDGESWKNA